MILKIVFIIAIILSLFSFQQASAAEGVEYVETFVFVSICGVSVLGLYNDYVDWSDQGGARNTFLFGSAAAGAVADCASVVGKVRKFIDAGKVIKGLTCANDLISVGSDVYDFLSAQKMKGPYGQEVIQKDFGIGAGLFGCRELLNKII